MRKYRNFLPIIGLLLLAITLFIMAIVDDDRQLLINTDKATELNHGWLYDSQDGQEEITMLPYHLDAQANEPYTIYQDLPEDFFYPQVLLIRASLAEITVKLDDQIIYQHSHEESSKLPTASLWHLVDVPKESQGKTLSITLTSPYQDISGNLNPIVYGSRSVLYETIIDQYGDRLLIGSFVLFSGLIMIIGSAFIDSKTRHRNGLVGLFAVLLSLWLIAESRMLQFVLGSHIIIGSLAYISLASFPIPMLVLVHHSVEKKYQVWMKVLLSLYAALLPIVIMLQLTGIADFYETVMYSQTLMGISLIVSITILLMIYYRTKDAFAYRILKITAFLGIFFVLEIYNFMYGDLANVSIHLSYGILILSLYLLYQLFRRVQDRIKVSYEKEFYQRLAYVDQLTGGKNRTAFEEDMDYIFSHNHEKDQISIIYIDIDDLKEMNDRYGHLKGDQYLVKAFEKISQHYRPYGECYRVGGDEFACIVKQMNESLLKAIKDQLQSDHLMSDMGEDVQMSLSIGFSSFQAQDEKPSDLIKRADEAMYNDKLTKKSKSKHFEE